MRAHSHNLHVECMMPSLVDLSHAVATAAIMPCVAIHTMLFDSSWKRARSEPRVISRDLPAQKELPNTLLMCAVVLMWFLQLLPPRAAPLSLDTLDELAVLGAGPFGKVSVAKHKVTGQCFALKSIAKASLISPKLAHQAIRERNVLQTVRHPFIMAFYGSFQDASNGYMVSEFIQGGELWYHLFGNPNGPFQLDIHGIRFYAANIAAAIHGLHSHGVVYRDLKMENMMLDKSGYVKLIDMGFAKQMGNSSLSGSDRRVMTKCGTPEYMAPEVLTGDGYGIAVDYWALGVVLYEIATSGERLFYRDDGNDSKIMARIKAVKTEGLPTSEVFTRLHPDVRSFIHGLLAYDPAERLGCTASGFQSIQDHALFRGHINWQALLAKRNPAPLVPHVTGPSDMRYFDVHPTCQDDFDDWSGCEVDPRIAAVFDEF
ncbi:hypothetical protein AeMF1_001461 [Aphanomyces euteiches]|nr:hypothetical protein AeMF1_001461 [Aphanomyces euteiches]KAH9193430.1 hypothetical protein AeNC1_004581 [Aphanomyces euteiches]